MLSMKGFAWAYGLSFKRPAAKLIAIRLGDICSPEGIGHLNIEDLARFAGIEPGDVQAELDFLIATVGLTVRSLDDGEPPIVILPLEIEADRPRQKWDPPLYLYVASSSLGTKVGISQDARKRVLELSAATLQPTTLIWSERGRASIIRKAEQIALQTLAADRVGGEWFTVSTERAQSVCLAALEQLERKPTSK